MAFKNAEKGSKGLAKLKMPMKRMADDEADKAVDDLDSEGSPDEEALESPDEEAAEQDEGSESQGDELSKASDDDLMAEVKKRGLMKQMAEGDESEEDDDSSYGMA